MSTIESHNLNLDDESQVHPLQTVSHQNKKYSPVGYVKLSSKGVLFEEIFAQSWISLVHQSPSTNRAFLLTIIYVVVFKSRATYQPPVQSIYAIPRLQLSQTFLCSVSSVGKKLSAVEDQLLQVLKSSARCFLLHIKPITLDTHSLLIYFPSFSYRIHYGGLQYRNRRGRSTNRQHVEREWHVEQ